MHGPHPETDEAITHINVVPLVDIMLVLLIIFMLTASFISTSALSVSTPKALTADPAAPGSQSLVLNTKDEIFYRNRKVGREELRGVLREQAALNPEIRIVFSADASIPHGKIVEMLDLLRQAGVSKIALGVSKP